MDQLYTLEEATLGLHSIEFDGAGDAITHPTNHHIEEQVGQAPEQKDTSDSSSSSDMQAFHLAMAQKRDREMGMKF
jgi:hypothetical protein